MRRFDSSVIAVLLAGMLCMSCGKRSEVTEIIPAPVSVECGTGRFTFSHETRILVLNDEQRELADWFAWLFAKPAGFVPRLVNDKEDADIVFMTDCEMKDEAYRLEVTPRSIVVEASGVPGFFYALQTLRYTLPADIHSSVYVSGVRWSVPAMKVYDEPRFRHRCLKMDVAGLNHYWNRMYDLLDYMALLKFNVLHLNMAEECNIGRQDLDALVEYASALQIDVLTFADALPFSAGGQRAYDPLAGFANRSLKEVYFYEPDGQEDFHSFLMSLFSSSWIDSYGSRDDIVSKLLPRIAALSEISWSPEGSKDWMRFSKSSEAFCKRMNFML